MDPNLLTTLLIVAVVFFGGGETLPGALPHGDGLPARGGVSSGGGLSATGGFVVPATEADITLLARIIEIEARGEPYLGKVAVGAVVVNRVKDPRFPSTIRDVIFEPNQFKSVASLSRFPVPSEESRRAAIEALRGRDPTGGALFFYNPDVVGRHPWWDSRPNRVRIGNHVFTR